MANLQAEIPERLQEEMERFVEAGWHRDVDSLVAEALRRYLDAHAEALMEPYVQADIEWGLRGQD